MQDSGLGFTPEAHSLRFGSRNVFVEGLIEEGCEGQDGYGLGFGVWGWGCELRVWNLREEVCEGRGVMQPLWQVDHLPFRFEG